MSETKKLKKDSSAEIAPVETYVGSELGTTGSIAAKGETDSRQYTNLNACEVLALSWLEQVEDLEGGAYARAFCESYRRHKMSESGWRAAQLVRIVMGSHGVSPISTVRRPGIIGRNITQRGWKDKAEREGAEIVE